MLIKINGCYFDRNKIDLATYKRIFPKATEKDFNKFAGIKKKVAKPKIIKNELQSIDSKKSKGTDKKVSKK